MIRLPNGGTKFGRACESYDCNRSADGGTPVHDATWDANCK